MSGGGELEVDQRHMTGFEPSEGGAAGASRPSHVSGAI
jgi:hypothetical protein